MTNKHDFKGALDTCPVFKKEYKLYELALWFEDNEDLIKTALRIADRLKSVEDWHLQHYEDFRDTDQVIDRHNEDGIEELARICYEATQMIKECGND